MGRLAELGSLKVGDYVLIEGEPCRIVSCERSKPGKHGAAKVRIIAIGLFDEQKRSLVSPVDSMVEVPILERRTGQILSVAFPSVQVLDLENYEVLWIDAPQELKDRLSPGLEVEYLGVGEKRKITRIRS